jgi:IMP dehydrogenase
VIFFGLLMRKKSALERAREEGFALTYDDVRLRSGFSEMMPHEVNVCGRFSRNVDLKIPIVSAAMDTVTEHAMAIELAKLGGLGIVHKNLSSEKQAKEVAKVKLHLNGFIEKPVCVSEDDDVKSILARMGEKGFDFQSFPVLNDKKELVGLLAGNDFEFCDDEKLLAREVMTTGVLTAKKGVTLEDAYAIMKEKKKKILPLVDDSNRVLGMYVFSDLKRIVTGSNESYNVDKNGRLRVGAAIGVGDSAVERAEKLVQKGVDVLVIDTAHGDSRAVYDTLRRLKDKFFDVDVVVGNVSNSDSVGRLVEAGADGIKVGQGPGSICTTRIVAGIGRPQLSAVYECAKVALEKGVPVCADGGLKNSGDITIALAAGASCVMMGGMLAGTEESPGKTIFLDGRPWKIYRGMGSLGAMQGHVGSRERYNQIDENKLVPEGVEGKIAYKGELANIIFQYVGGLRSGMGYVGAKNLLELREKGDFDRISSSGLGESHPHDVSILKDAPNYRRK